MTHYILNSQNQIEEVDLATWAQWFENNKRHVALTKGDKYVVSTVFLGIDHAFSEGPPVLFETMVFATSDWEKKAALPDEDCDRYQTFEQAKAGHVSMVKKWLGEDHDQGREGQD